MLAGYIFGGNDREQKIAMTSPVVMEMDSTMTMKFLVPAQYTMEAVSYTHLTLPTSDLV